ncbi:hypothetical protein BC939DRAFT_474721 [Gamsiella multidivaricata]|uniref:uncharacterized protein n=1 Tax=Gamsiella multidivaricata TaxID=101098 RepID=UPI002220E8D4|nr:uncharacterized protein BC939DRAFT_474721 [Gamsiella multidivaricata]KAG0368654.1 hypothetical protein BGZ54_001465 [Gamsiella multidivaricata]KAI7828542.1 hypothetical protein BC939DRAFT_474721 [Gamsiella multidivaricata]
MSYNTPEQSSSTSASSQPMISKQQQQQGSRSSTSEPIPIPSTKQDGGSSCKAQNSTEQNRHAHARRMTLDGGSTLYGRDVHGAGLCENCMSLAPGELCRHCAYCRRCCQCIGDGGNDSTMKAN